ncbi:MAG: AMIN domain-containing protein, partial [Gemmatimonadota bacterium]
MSTLLIQAIKVERLCWGLRVALVMAAFIWAAPAAAQRGATQVTGFRVVSAGDATQLVFETTGAVRYRDEFQPLPPRLTIELIGAGATLPLREYQDIYRGGVRYVVASAPMPDRVRFDIGLSGVSSYAVYQEGTELFVTFDNPGEAFPLY